MCLFMFADWANLFPQSLQLYGLTPGWVFTCNFKSLRVLNVVLVAILKCFFALSTLALIGVPGVNNSNVVVFVAECLFAKSAEWISVFLTCILFCILMFLVCNFIRKYFNADAASTLLIYHLHRLNWVEGKEAALKWYFQNRNQKAETIPVFAEFLETQDFCLPSDAHSPPNPTQPKPLNVTIMIFFFKF